MSVVCVVERRESEIQSDLLDLHKQLSLFNTPTELVVVLNGVDSGFVTALRNLVASYVNIQVYVMKRRVDHATALVAGIENAIGDWVATIDLNSDDPVVVRRLFESAVREGADVALSMPWAGRRPAFYSLASRLFHRTFEFAYGFSLAREAPSARLLSRAVVNSLLRHDSPLIALETLTATGGFRKCVVPGSQRNLAPRNFGESVHHRWRTLIGMNAAPLRLANLLCGVSAIGAWLYSAFVISVYLFKRDVIPGWTTVSLMLSFMFMMITLVLWLLSEYMLMLLDPGARHARYEIAEEFGGQVTSVSEFLNVETEL